MRKRPPNLIDKQFGFFTVISMSTYKYKKKGRYWNCRCRCGTEKLIPTQDLHRLGKDKHHVSCGCWRHTRKGMKYQTFLKRQQEVRLNLAS